MQERYEYILAPADLHFGSWQSLSRHRSQPTLYCGSLSRLKRLEAAIVVRDDLLHRLPIIPQSTKVEPQRSLLTRYVGAKDPVTID